MFTTNESDKNNISKYMHVNNTYTLGEILQQNDQFSLP